MKKTESVNYRNRELSWLAFNQRVLDCANDANVPLMERLKYLAITASNLDEFYMVRVGGLSIMSIAKPLHQDFTETTTTVLLAAISARVETMNRDQYRCLRNTLLPLLKKRGFNFIDRKGIDNKQYVFLKQLFMDELMHLLTPVSLQQRVHATLLADRCLHCVVELRSSAAGKNTVRVVLIPLPDALPRIVSLPGGGTNVTGIFLEEVVELFAGSFFPEECVVGIHFFRLTRNADLAVLEDQSPDLLEEMKSVLKARRRSSCVRLEFSTGIPEPVKKYLLQQIGNQLTHVFEAEGPLGLSLFMQFASGCDTKNLIWKPWPPNELSVHQKTASIFNLIAQKSMVFFHPYDSYQPVIRLVTEAAVDPDVLSIKQILYRISKNSPIILALIQAARNRKAVTVLVELKARFDEARNIQWAEQLENAGVQVIYGIRGMKTHAKLLVVMRREVHGIVKYCHFGTGNYNETTSKLYTDISYLTCDATLGNDATSFFNVITGNTRWNEYNRIVAAPFELRERILEFIHAESEFCRQGKESGIMVKVNALVDQKIIDALYAASSVGVSITLNVRGICCLRPGVKGLSENIRVISIVDRFLEHARIAWFRHGGANFVFISSADWMPRNLDKRVELMVPIDDPASKTFLMDLLSTTMQDTVHAWELQGDGTYQRRVVGKSGTALRTQEYFYERSCSMAKQQQLHSPTIFEQHRPRRK